MAFWVGFGYDTDELGKAGRARSSAHERFCPLPATEGSQAEGSVQAEGSEGLESE
jgi:hypothetical protein